VSLKLDLKFFYSWIACSLSMFILSYVWHAQVLNDFLKIPYPIDVFLIVSTVVYLGIGLVLTTLTYFAKKIKDSFKYGILIGGFMGISIYAITFVFGISFSAAIDLKYIAVDAGWQMLEQATGGLVCGWVYRLLFLREKRQKMLA
jgi:hypothetical protein